MIINKPYLSICIPSYNRPTELLRLLSSIDLNYSNQIEIIICEDKSPKRLEIREVVYKFNITHNNIVKYYENLTNLGYDQNLIQLISKSTGEYIIYMGDDDTFEKNNFGDYLNFLKTNNNLAYILRRYSIIHENNEIENFKYYPKTKYFDKGLLTLKDLFRKSVFISGFCFKREHVINFYNTNKFNGTLLYQLFLCGELVLNHKSAYCDIPITIMNVKERGIPEFGSSVNENKLYEPGKITISNSINFMKSFMVISNYFDDKYEINFTKILQNDISKYSYPILSIQRNSGSFKFMQYCRLLSKEININCTIYFYIYFFGLLFFGKKICDSTILLLKNIFNRTPNL